LELRQRERSLPLPSHLTEFRCRVLRGFGEGVVGDVGGVRFVGELGFAFGWIAPEPRFMQRAMSWRRWMTRVRPANRHCL
jgi:hypothetical protein